MNWRPNFNLFLFAFLFAVFVFGFPQPAAAADWQESWGYFECTRFGFRDEKECGSIMTFIPPGYAQYGTSIDLVGHRHGSSFISAAVCLRSVSNWSNGFCWTWWGKGNRLGPEFGGDERWHYNIGLASGSLDTGAPVCYGEGGGGGGDDSPLLPMNKSIFAPSALAACFPPSGDWGSGWVAVTVDVFVEDATARVSGTAWANAPQTTKQLTHYECRNNACTQVEGGGGNQCSVDADCFSPPPPPPPNPSPPPSGGCAPGERRECIDGVNDFVCGDDGTWSSVPGANCGSQPPPGGYNICTNDGACVRVRGSGANQCSDPGNPDSSNCAQPAPTCSSFISSPQKLVYPPAKSATLSWNCAKAHNGCSISPGSLIEGGGQNLPQSGSVNTLPLSQTTEFVLTCRGRGGASPEYRLPLGTLRVYQLGGGKIREVAP